ncbi:uncharacterized protein VTP21DRAFT_4053 [Calcarisporiella thermophila]|uniref:uncharacterized protein n=1 Tax=Calcarisporiella thermophila TaxID=911321 RepID=UPI003742C6C8
MTVNSRSRFIEHIDHMYTPENPQDLSVAPGPSQPILSVATTEQEEETALREDNAAAVSQTHGGGSVNANMDEAVAATPSYGNVDEQSGDGGGFTTEHRNVPEQAESSNAGDHTPVVGAFNPLAENHYPDSHSNPRGMDYKDSNGASDPKYYQHISRISRLTPPFRLQTTTSVPYCLLTYLIVLVFFACTMCLSWFMVDSLPPALSTDASTQGLFSAQNAWDHLSIISNSTRPVNSQRNVEVRNYIVDYLNQMRQLAIQYNRGVDVVVDDHNVTGTILNGTDKTFYYYGSSNVMARVVGTANTSDAILLSAHYDSVDGSYGATDDGIGIVVMMEILKSLIHNPVPANVIFNFNNGEEDLLYGALAFVKRPDFYNECRAFINLEGAGAGGPSMLFQASTPAILDAYRHVPYAHLNSIAADLYTSGQVQSDTDYSIYTNRYNTGSTWIPGADIALYQRRGLYHSPSDNLIHLTPGSLQQMGSNALEMVRSLASNPERLRSEEFTHQDRLVFFDILGRKAVIYRLSTHIIMNVVAVAVVPIAFVLGIVGKKCRRNRQGEDVTVLVMVLVVLRAFLFAVLSILVAVALMVGFSYAIVALDPFAIYGFPLLTFFHFIFLALAGLAFGQFLWTLLERRLFAQSAWYNNGTGTTLVVRTSSYRLGNPLVRERALTYAMVWLWWLVVIIALVFAIQLSIGSGYFAVYCLVCASGAALISYLFEGNKEERCFVGWWLARLVVGCFFPLILIVGIGYLTVFGVPPLIMDGSTQLLPYVFFILVTIIGTALVLPFMQRSGREGITAVVCLVVALALFIPLVRLFPFNDTSATKRVFFLHTYEPLTGKSKVNVLSLGSLGDIIDSAANAGANITNPICNETSYSPMVKCTYDVPPPPGFSNTSAASAPAVVVTPISNPENPAIAQYTVELNGTASCLLHLTDMDARVARFWVDDMDRDLWANSGKPRRIEVQLRNDNLAPKFQINIERRAPPVGPSAGPNIIPVQESEFWDISSSKLTSLFVDCRFSSSGRNGTKYSLAVDDFLAHVGDWVITSPYDLYYLRAITLISL